MKEIDHRSRISEQSPAMNPSLIQNIYYNGMTYYCDKIILGVAQQIPKLEADTNNLPQKLVSITGSLPNKYESLSFEQYISKVKCLQEITSSGPSDITPEMVKA